MRRLPFTVCLLLFSTVLSAYTINAPWRTPITYYINTANSYGFTPEQIELAVALAVKSWTDANPDLKVTYGGRTVRRVNSCGDQNVVYFDNSRQTNLLAETWSCYEYRTDSSGAQYRYRKYNSDIAIFEKTGTGGKRPFIIDDRQCQPSGWYVQDVMTHEMGHFFGLSHVGAPLPTMYRALKKCLQTWRTLEPDDFAGIKSLYPVSEKYWLLRKPPRHRGDIGIE